VAWHSAERSYYIAHAPQRYSTAHHRYFQRRIIIQAFLLTMLANRPKLMLSVNSHTLTTVNARARLWSYGHRPLSNGKPRLSFEPACIRPDEGSLDNGFSRLHVGDSPSDPVHNFHLLRNSAPHINQFLQIGNKLPPQSPVQYSPGILSQNVNFT